MAPIFSRWAEPPGVAWQPAASAGSMLSKATLQERTLWGPVGGNLDSIGPGSEGSRGLGPVVDSHPAHVDLRVLTSEQ